MYITDFSTITFEGNSTVILNNNGANNGGVMYIFLLSHLKETLQ